MGSENGGRGFTGDRERFTARERRELGQLDERGEAASRKVADCEAALKRFAVHLGEAFLEKKDPPRAAVDLQRQLTEAKQTVAACGAVRPEKMRTLQSCEKEWEEKARPLIEARVHEVLEAGTTLARQYGEWEAVRTAVFADIKHAAPWFPLPELPVLAPKLDYLLDTLEAWPPKPAASNGLVGVHLLPADRLRPLPAGHRLADAVTAALARHGQLQQYGPADTFGLPPADAELLAQVGRVERVGDNPHEPGVTS